MPRLRIHIIICNVPDESDKDEIYLEVNGKKIWPEKSKYLRIGVNESLEVKIGGKFSGQWMELELWDYDYTSSPPIGLLTLAGARIGFRSGCSLCQERG